MEKDHSPIKKIFKKLENNLRVKLWVRVPIAVSSCLAAAHMYRSGEVSALFAFF